MSIKRLSLLAGLALLAGCEQVAEPGRSANAAGFPRAGRAVAAPTTGDDPSEADRDAAREAQSVMDLAGIGSGMTVADIGAGEGYYTVRLAPRVGRKGRVLGEDIAHPVVERLGERVQRERLDNVSIRLGDAVDPRLPAASFDRVLLMHVYHEVVEPYAFLWYLRGGLRRGGRVVVVDADQDGHGLAPARLFCEFAAVGYRLTEFVRKPEIKGYYASFEAAGARPEPGAIKACR
jgi:ubiquinone/menaquinone biosynthesis C-methylase UbiE